jgi:hypothetical protein
MTKKELRAFVRKHNPYSKTEYGSKKRYTEKIREIMYISEIEYGALGEPEPATPCPACNGKGFYPIDYIPNLTKLVYMEDYVIFGHEGWNGFHYELKCPYCNRNGELLPMKRKSKNNK